MTVQMLVQTVLNAHLLKLILKLYWQHVRIKVAIQTLILTGSFNKQAMSAFSGNGTKTFEGSSQTLNTAIDIYVSDFGTLEIVYSPQSRDRSALVLDTSLWAMATLPGRSFMQTDLAKTGDTERKQVLCEWTLEARNESGNGIVADLTTS